MTPPELDRCPSCQAPHSPEEAFCWMCHRKFWSAAAKASDPKADPAPAPKPATKWVPAPGAVPPSASRDAFTQPVLIGAFILILTGMALSTSTKSSVGAPLLWLGLVPAFFVTALSGFRQPNKMPESLGGKVEWLLTKMASVVAVMILAGIAVSFALFAVCMALGFALGATH
ncbi:MAG: hypothetical protein ACHQ51_09415 [Elusimicrobiota bacterium]